MVQNSAHNPGQAFTGCHNSVIYSALAGAERDCVRYSDLFTGAYYLKNKDKRKQAARRYALLSECSNLMEVFGYTKKEVFEAYKTFEASSVTHYNSFLRKLKEFRKVDSVSCIHGRVGKTLPYKMNPYVVALVAGYLKAPNYYSASQVAEWTNINIEKHNAANGTSFRSISRSTVYHFFRQNRTEINFNREGRHRFDIAVRPYLSRIKARHAGSLLQMDGTPVQIFCWNSYEKQKKEGKKPVRLTLFVLRDVYSGKITGFDLSESEDRFSIINALKMHIKEYNHLPAEIVHDNSSATHTDEFESIKEHLENRGVIVRAAKVGNPQDKGEVERFFGTFQSRYQRLIGGFVGEGIRSKRANGRISEEFIKKCYKENGYYEYDEMLKIINDLISLYNNSVSSKHGNKTPNQLYAESEKPYIKKVNALDTAQMFWSNKKVRVRRSMIVNDVRKDGRIYEIWNDEDKLKLNGKKVRIYYDENDASEIHVFTPEGEFVCTCRQKTQIHEAAVDRQEGEEETIFKHKSHNDAIYKTVEEKATKRVKNAEDFMGQPFVMISPYIMEKEKINQAESAATLNLLCENHNIKPGRIKEYRPVDTGTPYNKERFLNENKKQSSKGIFTTAATIRGG
ncbi:MAG: Mu transposase C-terminal domain-containing protein [Dysgonamonadaceae bacterium]|jgi:transposase InsO family protein|nr:Mu transposase C-terminal domain-containing protein [Dysgonamonadaceae bacterium]